MVNVAEHDGYAVPDLSAVPGNQELGSDNKDALLCVRLDKELPLPQRAHPHDAGIDLYSAENVTISPGQRILISTGLAIGLPPGTVGLIHPRSGLAYKHGLSIVNSPGTIDEGYQGEIKVCLINLDHQESIVISRGDRIAQLVIQKVELPPIIEIADFSQNTARGSNGYGSTGGHESLAVHQEISSGYHC